MWRHRQLEGRRCPPGVLDLRRLASPRLASGWREEASGGRWGCDDTSSWSEEGQRWEEEANGERWRPTVGGGDAVALVIGGEEVGGGTREGGQRWEVGTRRHWWLEVGRSAAR